MHKRGWIILGIATGALGAFYEFVPRKTIKSIAQFLLFDVDILGHRIRHNDLILVATILLIISFVSFYKAFRLYKAKESKPISGKRTRT